MLGSTHLTILLSGCSSPGRETQVDSGKLVVRDPCCTNLARGGEGRMKAWDSSYIRVMHAVEKVPWRRLEFKHFGSILGVAA